MIQWNISDQQADQVLNALGQQPFIQVQSLIQELLRQAQVQKQPQPLTGPKSEPIPELRPQDGALG